MTEPIVPRKPTLEQRIERLEEELYGGPYLTGLKMRVTTINGDVDFLKGMSKVFLVYTILGVIIFQAEKIKKLKSELLEEE